MVLCSMKTSIAVHRHTDKGDYSTRHKLMTDICTKYIFLSMKLLWFLNCQHGYHKWRNVFFNIVIYISKNILKGCITLKRHINNFLNLWWIFWDSSVVLFLSAQNRKKYYSVCVVHFQISHDKKVDLKAFFYVSNWIFLVYLQKRRKRPSCFELL